ncbi:glutamate 5-kinase [Sciscionella sediminilitoris]|uniref:glutamate 5-kinase n=1 Tax=Sciscionella sediminilitoris TaxID=1445613 RepID=UPI0004DED961|nr:glutamate 5-kinase [Sciscionella sp. SE31]
MSEAREAIVAAKRIVVKVGSSSLTTARGGLDAARLDALVEPLAARANAGGEVVLVSSGAIAAGLAPLGIPRRPKDIAKQQAAASVGQLALVHAYVEAFGRNGLTVGQVLLTANDVVRRSHYRNAQRTLATLLRMGTIPVVNENDTVATEEIRFGDNDRLAALVAHLVGADALVLLSDVDALYDRNPALVGARVLTEITDPAELDGVGVETVAASGLGTGGMASKLAAARLASGAGIPVLLAGAEQAKQALDSASVGTAFAPGKTRLSARRFWLGYAADATGRLRLDTGAVTAVTRRRRSLLAAGILEVGGTFNAGDVVELLAEDGAVVARGVVAYDATELATMTGQSTGELPPEQRREVVHADDLVPLRSS